MKFLYSVPTSLKELYLISTRVKIGLLSSFICLRQGGGSNQSVEKVPSEDYVLAIHGQKGDDRMDASGFSGEVELDGGAGRDVLIGGVREVNLGWFRC